MLFGWSLNGSQRRAPERYFSGAPSKSRPGGAPGCTAYMTQAESIARIAGRCASSPMGLRSTRWVRARAVRDVCKFRRSGVFTPAVLRLAIESISGGRRVGSAQRGDRGLRGT
jgi:hypothetical protein